MFISERSEAGLMCSIGEVATAIAAPESFVAKILQDLVRKGLLASAKGPGGGFFLTDEIGACSLADIVSAIDGDTLFKGCALGLTECSEKRPCPLHHEFKKIRSEIKEVMEGTRLDAFSEALGQKLSFLKR
jgi:Rrf2 family protein